MFSTGCIVRSRVPVMGLAGLAAVLMAVGCAGVTGSASSHVATPTPLAAVPVPQTYFGMHVHHYLEGTPWPSEPMGTIRLWDSQTSWPDLEPSSGVWDFQRLDAYVAAAEAQQVRILYELGGEVPQWASAQPDQPSPYGPGTAAGPKNPADWENFVRTVATRYKGRILEYEIWNEADMPATYTGSLSDLVRLSRIAYQTLKEVDPSVTVVSPTSAGPVPDWLDGFLAAGGGSYADVIGYHFYDFPGLPENMIARFQAVRSVAAKYGIQEPIWDTEIGWGPGQVFSSSEQQAAFLARTFLLHWSAGIPRANWYAWDNHSWVTLWVTETDDTTPTAAGRAYAEVQQWLVGNLLAGCAADATGAWSCTITHANGAVDHAVWNPAGAAGFTVPRNWTVTAIRDLAGNVTAFPGGQVQIGESPVLLAAALP